MSYEYVDFGEQRDYKAERDTLKDDVLAWAVTCNNLEQENKKQNVTNSKKCSIKNANVAINWKVNCMI
ncbi:hypothetical protein [Staphylococcus equorum]|uniref:Uncharacterized protein n=1 Tax=Staphylococcus equorum TaxID=246432 RepID=A0AAP7ICN6_9STAP|nr:hypothetical protein [Staphylococcus equorum]OEK55725.1 hypothetical protein ASS94_08980 [Staphylococcus equorum]OEK56578.1 hypothetical protein ASS97_06000 [Staphylococcus equorum]OEK63586.1 hypothetical protein ASS99_01205 [Staphylococcus equorum]OEK64960.1 hypothetical protein ASS98_02040 [Staphylococcus equorum]RYD12859.1 hypothetical protein CGA19_04800 [Staphylococcus equorum]